MAAPAVIARDLRLLIVVMRSAVLLSGVLGIRG